MIHNLFLDINSLTRERLFTVLSFQKISTFVCLSYTIHVINKQCFISQIHIQPAKNKLQ